MVWQTIRERINNFITEKLNEPIDIDYALNENQRLAIRKIWTASTLPRIVRRKTSGNRSMDDFLEPDSFFMIEPPTRQQFSSYIIIGPPGTGKTTVIAYGALLYISNPQYRRGRPRIFLCTSSNYGADRIFEKLIEIIDLIGVQGWEIYIRRVIAQSVAEEEISQAVRNHVIKPRPNISEDPRDHQEQLDNAMILVGTIYACNDLLSPRRASSQCVLFDEASQLTPPEMYLPISQNTSIRSFGLIGDDCQLPPIASLEPLTHSCIDYLRGLPSYENSRIPERNQITLSIQYRMHPAIRDISSRFARRTILIRDSESVRAPSHLLQNYQGFERQPHSKVLDEIFNPQKTVVVIDTSELGKSGLDTRIRGSRINLREIEIIRALSILIPRVFPDFEINNNSLKIVSPYKPQARRLRSITGLNANTVDAFQGQEAQLVFYSLTFAEPDVKSRFMQNQHRILVGLSRAQKKLIIIGHKEAMNHPNFNYLRQNIFNYEYLITREPNVNLGYDPVSHISINQDFYNYLSHL